MLNHSSLTFDEALTDPNLLGAALGDPVSWATWRIIFKAAFGQPLTYDERATFDEIAGGREPPDCRVDELWIVAGRRGGKSRMAGALGAYLATFQKYDLAPGETGAVVALAINRRQARAIFNYAKAFLTKSPVLRKHLVGEPTSDEIRLRGNIAIEVRSASFRTIRSDTLIAALFDETAYWRDADSSLNPDSEIYTATLPALATTGGMLVGISSPYRKAGLLHRKFKESFGQNDPSVLVVRAPSRLLNPRLREAVIARARTADPDAARSEWDAEFRDDLADYVALEAVEACVEAGVFERPPDRRNGYVGFCDPSGGASDSMTLAIAHAEGTTVVLDAVREMRPPFSPEAVVAEFADLALGYRLNFVTGDRFGGEWVAEAFRRARMFYRPADQTKSQLYIDLLPIINSRAVDLLENERLVNQLAALERRTSRGGRDSIDHPPGGHDDVANAVAGAVVLASKTTSAYAQALREYERPPPGSVLNRDGTQMTAGDLFAVPSRSGRLRI